MLKGGRSTTAPTRSSGLRNVKIAAFSKSGVQSLTNSVDELATVTVFPWFPVGGAGGTGALGGVV